MIKAEYRGMLTGLALVAGLVLLAISVRFGLPGQALLHSLRFHFAVAFLALPILLLLGGARWRAMIMLALILTSLGQGVMLVWNQQSARLRLADLPVASQFRVMSYNVLVENPTPEAAAAQIIDTAADVTVVLEAPGLLSQFEAISKVFPYRAGCETPQICDTALFSRTPLIDARVRPLGELQRLRFITAKTVINGETVTLAAVHLSKPYFDENAPIELWQVSWALRNVQGPVVVMGDFNAAAWSDSVNNFLSRASLMPPPRYPSTWPVRAGDLGVPIDNIFTGGTALIDRIEAIPALGSNHRGLLATISLRGALGQ